jgi:hypothetical protein
VSIPLSGIADRNPSFTRRKRPIFVKQSMRLKLGNGSSHSYVAHPIETLLLRPRRPPNVKKPLSGNAPNDRLPGCCAELDAPGASSTKFR